MVSRPKKAHSTIGLPTVQAPQATHPPMAAPLWRDLCPLMGRDKTATLLVVESHAAHRRNKNRKWGNKQGTRRKRSNTTHSRQQRLGCLGLVCHWQQKVMLASKAAPYFGEQLCNTRLGVGDPDLVHTIQSLPSTTLPNPRLPAATHEGTGRLTMRCMRARTCACVRECAHVRARVHACAMRACVRVCACAH